jgi:rhamnose utilization protein RhaD (predicted bifunctional aldolase and dehydrogenase)
MNEARPATIRDTLLQLSHELGKPEHRLAILGEGNASARVDEATFLVKASGSELRSLLPEQLVQVRFDRILALLEQNLDDAATNEALLAARVEASAPKPSVETSFHAWLLRQEGVNFVGHTHSIEVNKILCSDKAELFATRRLFPDEIVCCGPRSLLIEYVDPGTLLALAIREGWQKFVKENGFAPRLILLKNHGMIAVGASSGAVLATTFMTIKAAEIFNGACANGEVVFMPPNEVQRIYSRQDEHYRQRMLKLL